MSTSGRGRVTANLILLVGAVIAGLSGYLGSQYSPWFFLGFILAAPFPFVYNRLLLAQRRHDRASR